MNASQRRSRVRVWDPLVRLTHWSLVVGFGANYLLVEEGGDGHQWIGYGVVGLIALRLLWGFIGPWPARWHSFWPTPARLRRALAGRSEPRLTHTPLGALMMLTLLGLLLGLGVTGYMMEETLRFWGTAWVEELHEGLANAIAVLVPLHVLGALLESRRRRDNLIAGMVHGYRRAPDETP